MRLDFFLSAILFLSGSQEGQDYLPWLLERLESPDPDQRSSSYHALLSEEGAAAACLERFPAAPALSREFRARLLWERGGDAQVPRALELFRSDPSPAVREMLLRFLCRSDLDDRSAAARCVVAEEAGLEGTSLADVAVESLQRMEAPCASEVLLRLFRRAPSAKVRSTALQALLKRWSGATELLDLAREPGVDRSFLPSVLLALGDRGESRARILYSKHWDDPDARVRAGARQGFQLLQIRRAQRGEMDLVSRDFADLLKEKGGDPELLVEQAHFFLMHQADLQMAETAVEKAIEKPSSSTSREAAALRARAQFLLGAVRMLRRESASAENAFARGQAALDAILRSVDDFEEPQRGYAFSVLVGKGWMLRALNSWIQDDSSLPPAKSGLLAAYAASEDAQRYRDDWLSQTRKKPGNWPYNMDEIFSGDLGVYALLDGPVSRQLGGEVSESLWRRLASMLPELDTQEFPEVLRETGEQVSDRLRDRNRIPSDFPVRFADFLESGLGRSEEALGIYQKIAQAWRWRLNDFPGFAQDVARVESRIASLQMDRRDGDETEKAIQRALGLLEDLSALLQARTGEGPDASIQVQRAAAYVSLAVNENVVRARPEAARVFLEKAYALDPSPFNRVLLACYEARAGRQESARRALGQVDPEPALFYNMACTFALLGESARALSYLEKHFDVALRGAGEKRRGVEWARRDPDLESLHPMEAFESLLRRVEDGAKESR